MTDLEETAELVRVAKDDPEAVSVFLSLGRAYLSGLLPDERERFLQSILARQGESDRWLLLLKHHNEYLGLVHMKIDKEERPGWGFILEFYIVPNKRRSGWGLRLFKLCVEILKERNVEDVWLLTDQAAERFWRSLGFGETGEVDKETGQKIMASRIRQNKP